MLKLMTGLVLATLVLGASAAMAQTEANHAPVCAAKTFTFSGMPATLDLTAFTLDVVRLEPACTDADGDTISLISISAPASLTADGQALFDYDLAVDATLTVTYTVSDGKDATTTATFIVTRK